MNDLESLLAAKIAVIKQEFLAKLQTDWLPNLRLLRQRFAESPADKELRVELMRAGHNMSGSGSVFGCDDISTAGRQLETRIRLTLDSDSPAAEADQRDILGLIDQLDAVCTEALRDAKPGADSAGPAQSS